MYGCNMSFQVFKDRDVVSNSSVERLQFFHLFFCASNHIHETMGRERKPKAKKGSRGGGMADERKGMMESGKVNCEVGQNKKEKKGGQEREAG